MFIWQSVALKLCKIYLSKNEIVGAKHDLLFVPNSCQHFEQYDKYEIDIIISFWYKVTFFELKGQDKYLSSLPNVEVGKGLIDC